MRHAHLACALGEQRPIDTPAASDAGVLHDPPQAFERMQGVPTMGGEAMEAKRIMRVGEGRLAFLRPMDPAPIDHQDHLFPGVAKARHHVVPILASLLRITGGHDGRRGPSEKWFRYDAFLRKIRTLSDVMRGQTEASVCRSLTCHHEA